ncbi:MAG: hypothetical protein R3C61_10185 [Bacteroidia bacterium]
MKTILLTVLTFFTVSSCPQLVFAGQVTPAASVVGEEIPAPRKPLTKEQMVKRSNSWALVSGISAGSILLVVLLYALTGFTLTPVLFLWAFMILCTIPGLIYGFSARKAMSKNPGTFDEKLWRKANRAIFFNVALVVLSGIYPVWAILYIMSNF